MNSRSQRFMPIQGYQLHLIWGLRWPFILASVLVVITHVSETLAQSGTAITQPVEQTGSIYFNRPNGFTASGFTASKNSLPSALSSSSLTSLDSIVSGSGGHAFSLGDPLATDNMGLEGVIYRIGGEKEGYHRWNCLIRDSNGQPIRNDLSLRLKFEVEVGSNHLSVDHPIEIAAGDTESQTSFLVPWYIPWCTNSWQPTHFKIQMYRNAGLIKGLSTEADTSSYTGETRPHQSLLLASDEVMQRLLLEDWKGIQFKAAVGPGSTAVVNPNANPGMVALTPETKSILSVEWPKLMASGHWTNGPYGIGDVKRMPEDWLEIAAFEHIVISSPDISMLNSRQRDCLMRYAMAGGKLIITDASVPPYVESGLRAWLMESIPEWIDADQDWVKVRHTLGYHGRSIQVGLGTLVLSQDPLNDFGEYAMRSVGMIDRTRTSRRAEFDAMTWFIPRVGQPPVVGFCVVIGLFAFVAGPSLLWWTSYRLKRPVMVLMLFPPLALLITGSIFAYTLSKDGFGTIARIRSFTWLDQTTARGVSYSKQTYFSGSPPRSIDFSPSSEVWLTIGSGMKIYGLISDPISMNLKWSKESQSYTGFLKPREQCQWTVTTPIDSQKPFEWVSNPSTKQPLRIKNTIPDNWLVAFFCDASGTLYRAAPTKSGADAVIAEIDSEAAETELRKYHRPLAYPEGYQSNRSNGLTSYMISGGYHNSSGGSTSDLLPDAEWIISAWLTANEFAKAHRFVMVLDRASFLDRPKIEYVQDSDSFHLLVGIW